MNSIIKRRGGIAAGLLALVGMVVFVDSAMAFDLGGIVNQAGQAIQQQNEQNVIPNTDNAGQTGQQQTGQNGIQNTGNAGQMGQQQAALDVILNMRNAGQVIQQQAGQQQTEQILRQQVTPTRFPLRPVLTLQGGTVYWASNLVLDGRHEYWVYVDSSHNPWLATNAGASGRWANYNVGVNGLSNAGGGKPMLGIAVHNGVVYIPYIAGDGSLDLTYNPTGNPAGPWVQATIVTPNPNCVSTGLGCETTDPSAALSGANLVVVFDDAPGGAGGTASGHANDVYDATLPLSALSSQSGGSPAWNIGNLTGNPASPAYMAGGSGTSYAPFVTSNGSYLDVAWQSGGSALSFIGGASHGLRQTAFTLPGAFNEEMQVAVGGADGTASLCPSCADMSTAGGVAAIAMIANGQTGYVNYAATNAGGSWSYQLLPGSVATNNGSDRPSAAVGLCGPAVAYDTPSSHTGTSQVHVAIFLGGQWRPQAVGVAQRNSNDPQFPALAAATSDGFDLVYVSDDSGSPKLYAQFIGCRPPVVGAVSPGSGPAIGGTLVTLTGSGFTGATQVVFQSEDVSGSGGPAARLTVVSDTQITVVTPRGRGTVDVLVTTPVGSSAVTKGGADAFTYTGGDHRPAGGRSGARKNVGNGIVVSASENANH